VSYSDDYAKKPLKFCAQKIENKYSGKVILVRLTRVEATPFLHPMAKIRLAEEGR
jgi:hypothetical protein